MLCLHFSALCSGDQTHPISHARIKSDSWLIEPLSFHDTNTSTTLVSKYFATFMVAITAVSDQSHSLECIYIYHISVTESCSFAKSTDGDLLAREKNTCPTPWQTFSSSLEPSAASTITAPAFLSPFPSSKRHGPNPTGIYKHLTVDFTDLLLSSANLAQISLLLPAFLCSWTLQGNC